MSDSVAMGLVAGGGLAGVGGAALAYRGSMQPNTPPEFPFAHLDNLIKASNTPPGPLLEHAASDVVIGSRTIDSQSAFATMTRSGQLDNINMWTRTATGEVKPTQFASDLASLTRATESGRGKRFAGIALMGVGLLGVVAGSQIAGADN